MDLLKEIVYPVLDDARSSMETARAIPARPDAPLFGADGLNSLDLVSFIIMVEEKIDDDIGVRLTLASEQAMSRRNSPFRTLQSLAEYIGECLQAMSSPEEAPHG